MPQPYSRVEMLLVYSAGALGVGATVVWLIAGHPRTHLFREGYDFLFGLGFVLALMSRAGRRLHRMAVGGACAFVFSGAVSVTGAVAAFAVGGQHAAGVVRQLLVGLAALALFGTGPVISRRMWRPERSLPAEVAARLRTLGNGSARQNVWLTLVGGRRVPATVLYGTQLSKLPDGVTAVQVANVQLR